MPRRNPTISELRSICQASVLYRTNLPIRLIHKRISIYLTKLFLYTPITPNQITVLTLLVELIGASLFCLQHYLWGAICYHVAIVLDNCDGEVARYKGTCSTEGIYLDIVTHYVTYPAIFIGLSVGIYRALGDPWVLLLGAISAVCVTLIRISSDVKYVVVAEAFIRKEEKALQTQDVDAGKNKNHLVSLALSGLHLIARYCYQSFTVFSLVILIWLINIIMGGDINVTLRYMIYFYGFTYPFFCFILFAKVVYNKESQQVIQELREGVNRVFPHQ